MQARHSPCKPRAATHTEYGAQTANVPRLIEASQQLLGQSAFDSQRSEQTWTESSGSSDRKCTQLGVAAAAPQHTGKSSLQVEPLAVQPRGSTQRIVQEPTVLHSPSPSCWHSS